LSDTVRGCSNRGKRNDDKKSWRGKEEEEEKEDKKVDDMICCLNVAGNGWRSSRGRVLVRVGRWGHRSNDHRHVCRHFGLGRRGNDVLTTLYPIFSTTTTTIIIIIIMVVIIITTSLFLASLIPAQWYVLW